MSNGTVEVVIGGHRLLVSSEHAPEYTREVAARFDQAVQRIRAELPSIDAHRAALLAGMAVTDELLQARQQESATARRVLAVTDQLSRLLPPNKRGSRAQSPVA
jgi:cell division protein ZapA (FtsZ GTPase activity inhibitor)